MRARPVVPGVAGFALLALTVLVGLGWTQGLDDRMRALFRPGDQWGELQMRVDIFIETFSPRTCVLVLVVATVLVAMWRRSWRPVLAVALTLLAGGVLTAGLQLTVGRPDTHGVVDRLGGSFPSGHVATISVVAGCLVLLARPTPHVLAWIPVALAGGMMGWVILVQTAHWFTDVIGGALVAVLVLALATRLPFSPQPPERATSPNKLPASWP